MDSDEFDGKLDLLLAQALQEAKEVGRLAPNAATVLETHARAASASAAARVRREVCALSASSGDVDGTMAAGSEPWTADLWATHRPPPHGTPVPRYTRIGEFECSAAGTPETFILPAVVPLLGSSNLLFRPTRAGVDQARRMVASVAIRLLATAPPSSVWVYVVDPLGAGGSFPDLTHFSDEVVRRPENDSGGGWGGQIERLLDEVSTHIEMVKTTLPRSRHKTFEDYNADSTTAAIPYRVMLIADFPYGFSSRAFDALVRIARNGPSVGVHLITLVDSDQPVPHGVRIDALAEFSLVARQGPSNSYALTDPVLASLALLPDALPTSSEALPAGWQETEWRSFRPGEPLPTNDTWIHRLAAIVSQQALESREAAERARRQRELIQVGIDDLAPMSGGQVTPWLATAEDRLLTPIGLSLDERGKRQDFVLDESSLPHALVTGATGRGKTNLLHAIILGLCWRLSPAELELWLLDFKDGLGFQGYRQLPQAKLVALKGERELGVEVLRRLNKDMLARGERFKEARLPDGGSVNKIAEYRAATGETMPRVLLIFDEFQGLLRGTDPVATEAASLLATLAQKGRQYGFHIILATQSPRQSGLTGAIQSQLATKITMYLDAADSQLVLHSRNSEAVTLQGKGEAIYNSGGGLPERNQRFQVALTKEATIPGRVASLVALATTRSREHRGPRVLDGTLSPSPALEPRVSAALSHPPREVQRSVRAFLGMPVDLDDEHISLTLARQTKRHLLVFGRNEFEDGRPDCDALAMVLGAMATAATQSAGTVLRLVAEFEPGDRLSALPPLLCRAPGDVRVGDGSDFKLWIEEFAAEVERRANARGEAEPLMLLGVIGLHLFSFLDGRPGPLQDRLRTILQRGPLQGVHMLVHAEDSAGLVSRVIDHREFGTRVATRGSIGRKLFEITRANAENVESGEAWLDRVEKPGPSRRLRTYGRAVFSWLESLPPL